MPVIFSYADRTLTIKNKTLLKRFIKGIFDGELQELDNLNYVFCSDEYLLDINQRFLQHNYYTDIITFDLSGKGEKEIAGEIYLSVDRVRENAKTLGVSFENEMLRVIFHGALHLCGYGDKKKSEIPIMREREDHYIRLYSQYK